ncbi:MAG: thiamine pyrophosphate-binding protein [Chloroflexi bacterium]|nr:thiamine pyrophosphate-binding protein [Chloroflexota bacterium]
MINGILHPKNVVAQLVQHGVSHYVTLPDSETANMYEALMAEPSITIVPVAREGEAIPVAAGLFVAGQNPVISIQNAGLFEAGDALRGLGLGIGLPLVMFIGYRGHNRKGDTPDSAATFLEPYLHMWRVEYFVVESNDDLERVPLAFDLAKKTNQPVAVAIGTEYASEHAGSDQPAQAQAGQ